MLYCDNEVVLNNVSKENNQEKLLSITEEAILKIESVASQDEYLHISVEAGGCNGFEYQFEIKTLEIQDYLNRKQEDFLEQGIYYLTHSNRILVGIEEYSLSMIKSSVLHYQKDIIGERFIMKNPASKSSCSCGNSFSV